jgi:hypothetical protein
MMIMMMMHDADQGAAVIMTPLALMSAEGSNAEEFGVGKAR